MEPGYSQQAEVQQFLQQRCMLRSLCSMRKHRQQNVLFSRLVFVFLFLQLYILKIHMIEFYALRLSSVIFGISLLIILALLGWFNLHINFGIIAITLSVFLASICSTFLKIYLYK